MFQMSLHGFAVHGQCCGLNGLFVFHSVVPNLQGPTSQLAGASIASLMARITTLASIKMQDELEFPDKQDPTKWSVSELSHILHRHV